jgi:hypothetical protein
MGDLIQFIESYVRSLTANSERCVSFMIEHDPLAGSMLLIIDFSRNQILRLCCGDRLITLTGNTRPSYSEQRGLGLRLAP